ncbi:MAG: recombinase family protein [Arcicella sp.]|nr:recombinase family protein [Arcicella sp.]
MNKAIAYYRVSTDRQGKSGLGLEAQNKTVQQFATFKQWELIGEFTEIESGKKNNRPQLQEALKQCLKQKAVLVIAKLDRLGRNVAFISSLMESKVEFVAVDNPHANRLMLHLLAAFAEHEREQISTRTKEALKVAKNRGIILGKHGKNVLSQQNIKLADDFAETMTPIISELKSDGFITLRALRDELNNRSIASFRKDCQWHLDTVFNITKRIDTLK